MASMLKQFITNRIIYLTIGNKLILVDNTIYLLKLVITNR